MNHPLRIALTCGEPAGIGAEVALRALVEADTPNCEILLVGPADLWQNNARLVTGSTSLPFPVREPEGLEQTGEPDWRWGEITAGSAQAATRSVETAVKLALAGEVDALVTAPLTKEGLHLSGCDHAGHTEWLGQMCEAATGRASTPTMMFDSPDLKVVLVTTHLPLSQVAGQITRETVLLTITACREGLVNDFGLDNPRIGICGLNPHAGEKGILGDEESLQIAPAVEAAKAKGWEVAGPVPADALFHRAYAGGAHGREFDAVVAMYHDQGLGPFKLIHFHDGVNVTLGLPIVRTSPDHGTALEIAGSGAARPDSMIAAIRTAAEIARRRRGNNP